MLWNERVGESSCSALPDSTLVLCYGQLDRDQTRMTAYDSTSGEKVATTAFAGEDLEFSFRNDVLYSCFSDEDSVVVQAGTISDPGSKWRHVIPADNPTSCTLFEVNDAGAFVKFGQLSSDDLYRSLVISQEGQVVMDRSGALFYAEGVDRIRLAYMNSDESVVYDSAGVEVFKYTDDIGGENAFIGGDEGHDLMIDSSDTVRDRNTGEILWTYRGPDNRLPIRRVGDTVLILENMSVIQAYDALSGEKLWSRGIGDVTAPGAGYDEKYISSVAASNNRATDTETKIFFNGKEYVALNLADGSISWRISAPAKIEDVSKGTFVTVDDSSIIGYRF